jgi:peroxiredoxin
MPVSYLSRPLALLLCLILPGLALATEPEFADLSGQPRALAEYTGKGQWTVVMIWASDCGICRHEAPGMEAFHQRFKDGEARVLGLSVDGLAGMAAARDFVSEERLSFPSLVGSAEDVAALYFDHTGSNLIGTPAFLIFNPQGQLRSYQAGSLNMAALEQLIRPQPLLSAAEGR